MSKTSYLGVQNNSVVTEEPGIQKHVKFWDRKNKGYITPLDTISGFITLGYSVIFSIAIGAFVGVFLSLSTQKGWMPDPLCRSNVRNLIRAKKQTQTNQGAFDANGVFVPEKFDNLFNKYAKSDKSGNTISVAELVRMTEEQEKLGKDVKAWAASMIELCTAYFFIGHRGSLTREDVRSAYDGTLFYRLKDAHRLMIKQGSAANIDSTGPGLGGSYLASSHGRLSIKGLEHRFQALLNALQSKSSAAVAEYRLRDWVAYIQESTNSIKEGALPSVLKRSPSSGVRGVTTPKTSLYRTTKKEEEDPANLFPNGLTGVAKSDSETLLSDSGLLNSLLQNRNEDEIAFTNETYKISNFSEAHEPIMFKYLTKEENNLLASAAQASLDAQSERLPVIPEKSVSTTSNNSPLMSGFLRSQESDDQDWNGSGLTGVKSGDHKRSKSPVPTPPKKDINKSTAHSHSHSHSHHHEHEHEHEHEQKDKDNVTHHKNQKEQNHSKTKSDEKNSANGLKKHQETLPSPPKHDIKTNEESAAQILKEATITPPPEEKISSHTMKNTNSKKTQSANSKKVKNKNKNDIPDQISPSRSSESGQDKMSIKRSNSVIDTTWAIAADTK